LPPGTFTTSAFQGLSRLDPCIDPSR
jgi:hypothetical protein